MKKLIIVIIFLWSLPSYAQQPHIDSMVVNEDRSELVIFGNVGNNGSKPQVFIDSVPIPVTSWSDTSCTCILPDSGKGSAGPVWVETINKQSNTRVLTMWRGMYKDSEVQPHSAFEEFSNELHFSFRLDLQSCLISKNRISLNVELMHNSLLTCTDNQDNMHDGNGYLSRDGVTTLPLLHSKTKSDSSFNCYGLLDISKHTLTLNIYSIEGFIVKLTKTYYDSTGPHSNITFSKWSVSDFSFIQRLDSSFNLINLDTSYIHNFNEEAHVIFKADSLLFPPPKISNSSISNRQKQNEMFLWSHSNPATKIVTLSFDLPKASPIEITIHSVTGECMKRIHEAMQEIGQHELPLDISGFPAGSYFVTVTAGGFSETVKIISEL